METLEQLSKSLDACNDCPLAGNERVVKGIGHTGAKVMILGEAPGFHESQQGKPFVGKSGQLLQELLREASYTMGDLYITNVVKHRPPNNRDPVDTEITACGRFLDHEIKLVNPALIVCVGRVPTRALHVLANKALPTGSLRGYVFEYRGYPVRTTWHPAYVLRNPNAKAELLNDLKQALADASAAREAGHD